MCHGSSEATAYRFQDVHHQATRTLLSPNWLLLRYLDPLFVLRSSFYLLLAEPRSQSNELNNDKGLVVVLLLAFEVKYALLHIFQKFDMDNTKILSFWLVTFMLGCHCQYLMVISCESIRRFRLQVGMSPRFFCLHCFRIFIHNQYAKTGLFLDARQLSKDGRHDSATPFQALPIATRIRIGALNFGRTTRQSFVDIVTIYSRKEIG